MRFLSPAILAGAAIVVLACGLSGCASAATADMNAGDCLKIGGTPEHPDATEAPCGSKASTYKVVSTVDNSDLCPPDVDSYYTLSSPFSTQSQTVCMDVDWVVGGCMSIDPDHTLDPVRVDCGDAGASNRQRATQILSGVADVDQCGTGIGYAYSEREFTVCVEDLS